MPDYERVVMIKRGKDFIVPKGSIVLQEGDKLLVLVNGPDRKQ